MLQTMQGYVAAVIDSEGSEFLKKLALHPQIFCHHMTMAYKPTSSIWAKYEGLIGQKIAITISAIRANQHGQAAVVSGVPSENIVPHITISCADGIEPNYSNQMLQEESGDLTDLNATIFAMVEFIPIVTEPHPTEKLAS